ncbi:MAG: Glutamyl-tRNA(Gln) amidotransferase subunit, partial [Pseudomonadota bacterium]
MTQALHHQSLSELSGALRAKALSAVELAQHFLARAQADTSGAFLDINPDATLAQARAADAHLAAGCLLQPQQACNRSQRLLLRILQGHGLRHGCSRSVNAGAGSNRTGQAAAGCRTIQRCFWHGI